VFFGNCAIVWGAGSKGAGDDRYHFATLHELLWSKTVGVASDIVILANDFDGLV
jgi:hypothetical protein